jgi:phosphoglycerate dehydrogenase-like enzyme
MKLLLHPAVDETRWKTICEAAAGGMQVVNADSLEEALLHVSDADAFFGKMTPQLLAASSRLKWVQSPTASLEHFVFPELIEHPLILTNMRGLFSDVIADHVFGYILCFARNLHHYIRQQERGLWAPVGGEESRAGFVSGPGHVSALDRAHRHMSDQTLCVVGLGAIGKEVARRGLAFGMRVVAVDPHCSDPPEGLDRVAGMEQLNSLLGESDFVVVAAPHTPQTEGMFSEPQFRAMKQDSYLINIGRGAIVSLDDLVAALEGGQIAGAGLDVFELEPLPPEHPLWRRDDVILTPHIAGASPRIAERHLSVLLENIRRFVAGDSLLNVANKSQWF